MIGLLVVSIAPFSVGHLNSIALFGAYITGSLLLLLLCVPTRLLRPRAPVDLEPKIGSNGDCLESLAGLRQGLCQGPRQWFTDPRYRPFRFAVVPLVAIQSIVPAFVGTFAFQLEDVTSLGSAEDVDKWLPPVLALGSMAAGVLVIPFGLLCDRWGNFEGTVAALTGMAICLSLFLPGSLSMYAVACIGMNVCFQSFFVSYFAYLAIEILPDPASSARDVGGIFMLTAPFVPSTAVAWGTFMDNSPTTGHIMSGGRSQRTQSTYMTATAVMIFAVAVGVAFLYRSRQLARHVSQHAIRMPLL